MPAPTNFHAKCSAPFVVLATPPSLFWGYETLRGALQGHGELQDDLVFVEFKHGATVYFGAQAKSEDVARRFFDLAKTVKGIRPQLTCLDAVSRIADRYAPPPGMRLVLVNLTTGELIRLDTGEMLAPE